MFSAPRRMYCSVGIKRRIVIPRLDATLPRLIFQFVPIPFRILRFHSVTISHKAFTFICAVRSVDSITRTPFDRYYFWLGSNPRLNFIWCHLWFLGHHLSFGENLKPRAWIPRPRSLLLNVRWIYWNYSRSTKNINYSPLRPRKFMKFMRRGIQ